MRIKKSESRIQVSGVSCQLSAVSCLLLLVCFQFSILTAKAAQHPKATEVVAAAIEAMGGKNYLEVKNYHKIGRYFIFDQRGRSSFTNFSDWTVLEPIKWRFQLGEDKRQQVQIYNLEIGKGWTLEGESSVEEITEEEVREFEVEVQRDIDILLRERVDEEGMSLFYYGPEEIAGSGEYEAVEFLDATNFSVVIFLTCRAIFHRKWRLTSPIGQGFVRNMKLNLPTGTPFREFTLPCVVTTSLTERCRDRFSFKRLPSMKIFLPHTSWNPSRRSNAKRLTTMIR